MLTIQEFDDQVRFVCDWCGSTLTQPWSEPIIFPAGWMRIPMQEGWIGFYDACSSACERALVGLITHKGVLVDEDEGEETRVFLRHKPKTFLQWVKAWETRWKRKKKEPK